MSSVFSLQRDVFSGLIYFFFKSKSRERTKEKIIFIILNLNYQRAFGRLRA